MRELRFFADHCVPRSVVEALRATGAEVLRLKGFLPTGASDQAVIARSRELGAILVSLNGDFADIVAYPPASFQGVIALQVHDHPEIIPHLLVRLRAYLEAHPAPADFQGKLLVVEPHRIRIRQ